MNKKKVQAGDVVRQDAVSRIRLGKRGTSDEIAGEDSSADTKPTKRRSSPKNNMVSSMFAALSEERSKAMSDMIQLQQDQFKQRQMELEFEREQREKEREERQKEREVQQALINSLVELIRMKPS